MDYRWLFFNFTDRLPRFQWFAATACISAAAFFYFYIRKQYGAEAEIGQSTYTGLDATIVAIQTILTLGLNVKRFNDLNFPYWVGLVFTASYAFLALLDEVGLFSAVSSFEAINFLIALLLYSVTVAAYAWLCFHRGTFGDNFYGADPLAGAPEVEKLPGASGAPPHFNVVNLLALPHGRIGRLTFIACILTTLACFGGWLFFSHMGH
ncbi:MAG: DUF805 domain-containing protein [Hyphomicrobiales bacterium]